MEYLKRIRIRAGDEQGWPFSLPVFHDLDTMAFTTPVTILVGENGSGKSTLLEALAIALNMPAIGRTDAARDDTLSALRPLARSLQLTWGTRPKTRFFLRSEDFFGFVQRLRTEVRELEEDLVRVDAEYRNKSRLTRNLARSAFAGSMDAYRSRYGTDLLEEASHGESYLRLFQSRIVPGGLYLLDEPESPLSPIRQLALLSLLMDKSVNEGCQFILATHSPILMALPGAVIYSFDTSPASQTCYDELPSVTLLRDFLACPERMIREL